MPKLSSSRAQVSIEFLIIIGAVFFFTSILLLGIQKNNEDKIYTHQNIQLKEIALTVQNEINLALESSEGYSRNFQIPEKAGSLDYEITIAAGMIYLKTTNNKHALAIPAAEVTGNINKTQNTITKTNGVIYLNQ